MWSKYLCEVLEFSEVQDIISYWRRTGLQLKLRYGELECIECNKARLQDRVAAMLRQWLISGRVTKQALVDALQRVK